MEETYEKFYNLKRQPFHITPDPRFLYLSETHKQALAALIHGIEKRKGFVAITGDAGVGKTTIVRSYLERAMNVGLEVIYVFQANASFEDLVRTIYRELSLEPAATDLMGMVNGLHQALIEVHRQGKTVVVIIDEAQSMTLQTLENLRILSNLMTTTDKLIQIVLVGQTQFERLLEMNDLGQHKQRVVVHSKIVPLSAEESYVYIEHRLSVAGLSNSAIFSKEALDTIVKEANGIPRRLNAVCEQALISGFRYQKNPVTVRIAREVVSDFTSKQKQPTVRKWTVAALVGVTVLLAFLAVFAVSSYRNTVTHTTERAGLEQTTKSESAESRPLRLTEPEVPVKVESAPEPANEAGQKPTVAAPPYARRVVRSGETLVGLIREVYHIGPDSLPDDSLIDLVRRYNPAILDPNRILAGSVILFPEPPKGTRQSP